MGGAVRRFNASGFRTPGGKPIWVNALALESSRCVDETLAGHHQPDIISLTSSSSVAWANERARARNLQPLLGDTVSLARSPLVIAMWKPLANAMGYGRRPLGWNDLRELATDSRGWGKYGLPAYGRFKLGHNSPFSSSEGLLAVLAETYAGAGAQNALSAADVQSTATGRFVGDLEKSIVAYGDTSASLNWTFASGGPKAMNAALLFESQVYGANRHLGKAEIVAIYPREGTLFCDHPAGVVNRGWVTPERHDAASQFLQFLRAPEEQSHAVETGLRPADPGAAMGAPFDSEHGLDPAASLRAFPAPGPNETKAAVSLWHAQRKPADVLVVFDDGGAISERRLHAAMCSGLKEFVSRARSGDSLAMLPTNRDRQYLLKAQPLGPRRDAANAAIDGMLATGDDSVYDSLLSGYNELAARDEPDVLQSIVVVDTDEDLQSSTHLEDFLKKLQLDHARHPIAVYTIQFTQSAPIGPLQSISSLTGGRTFQAAPESFDSVCRVVSQYL